MLNKQTIERADKWLDSAVAGPYKDQPLAQDWARVCKVIEELGEAIAELILFTGQNPRKGIDPEARDRLLKELGDVVLTGALAMQHFTKDTYLTEEILWAAQGKLESGVPDDL